MRWYKADMHVHTVLSPCGGLDMSPKDIVVQAIRNKLDMIAVTDHNSTKHCRLMQQIGERQGITVIPGAEVTTREEIHCLVFFDNYQTSERFQEVIDRNLIIIPNRPDCFGQQLIVDEMDNILDEEDRLLTSALELSIEETAEHVHALGGLLVPAHINRKYNALFSQLGFIPSHLQADALEVCRNQNFGEFLESHPEIKDYPLVTNSDAHCIGRIGEEVTEFYLEAPMFAEIKMALKGVNGRKVKAL